MIKMNSKSLFITSLLILFLTGCQTNKTVKQTLENEIAQANECLNSANEEFENDCYDLISYKNSVALLRSGIKSYTKGNYNDALKKYSLAKIRGNFYANTLLSELYIKGKGVAQNQKKALELLKDVEDIDPIAAYKLSFYYLNKKDYKKAINLLEFASQNNVKEAKLKLAKIYQDGKITKMNMPKGKQLYKEYEDTNTSFINKIYGK